MADALSAVARPVEVKTGVTGPKMVAKSLSDALSSTYSLLIRTHVYHWNVTGPTFYGLHHLMDEQYNDLFIATDVMAERIRSLGQLAPLNLSNLMAKDGKAGPSPSLPAEEMVADLIEHHEVLAKTLHTLIDLAQEHKDPVTADLATKRSAFHEQAVWMLRATLSD
ncbi:MAG: DNA starvation/stationary phase protection protein [bacterium]